MTADLAQWGAVKQRFVAAAKRPTDQELGEEFGLSAASVKKRRLKDGWNDARNAFWGQVQEETRLTAGQAAREMQKELDAASRRIYRTFDAINEMFCEAVALARAAMKDPAKTDDALKAIAVVQAVGAAFKTFSGGGMSGLLERIKPGIPVQDLKALSERS